MKLAEITYYSVEELSISIEKLTSKGFVRIDRCGNEERLSTIYTSLEIFIGKEVDHLKKTSILLTNNQAERCMRGFVIHRKISFGTTSDAGDKFRSRIHTLVETCKKWGLSVISVLTDIITSVVEKKPYSNVFDL